MGRYVNNSQKVEHGRTIHQHPIVERIIEKPVQLDPHNPPDINIEELAKAVAIAIANHMPIPKSVNQNLINPTSNQIDTFDNTKTMEKLANSMIVQRGKNESNFEDLGNVNETKKTKEDNADVNKTIDLLSNLKD